MVNVYGKNMSKAEFLQYFGDYSQYASAVPYVLDSGNGAGVKGVDIKTGTGLEYTVLTSRAVDIAHASYKGISLGYISKSGIVNPMYYESKGLEWLRTFYAGLLTTCGLTYMGAPCIDNGKELGLHGRIANAQASDVSVNNEWMGNDLVLQVAGKSREAVLFGENMIMSRRITSKAGESKINISTTVENLGFNSEPLMMLFHFNIGYPMLSPRSKFIAPVKKVTPRDDDARADNGVALYDKFHEPVLNYKEKVFFLDLKADSEGNTEVLLYNEDLQIGLVERFNINECTKFVMWKQLGKTDYVLGLEPGNAYPLGRDKIRERKELVMIEPQNYKEFSIEIAILDGKALIDHEIEKIKNIGN